MNIFLETLFALIVFVAILFLVYITTKFMARKASKAMKSKHIKVIESVSLGLDRQLLLVKVAQQYVLLSSSGKSIQFLADVNLTDEDIDLESEDNVFDFKNIFDKYINVLKKDKNSKKDIVREVPDGQNTNSDEYIPNETFKNNVNRLRSITTKVDTNRLNHSGKDNTKDED